MTTNEAESEFGPRRVRSHRDLIVYRKAIELAAESYRLASTLPDDERDIIAERIHRSSISIPTNIAQGHGLSTKSCVRHLDNACGSLAQLMTMFEIGKRLDYFDEDMLSKAKLLANEVERMLGTLMDRLGVERWN